KSWSIDTDVAPTDKNKEGHLHDNCNSCHRLAVSNHPLVKREIDHPTKNAVPRHGSAWAFSTISTAKKQTNKVPHGPVSPKGTPPDKLTSPIWMRPDQVKYEPGAEDTAKRYQKW